MPRLTLHPGLTKALALATALAACTEPPPARPSASGADAGTWVKAVAPGDAVVLEAPARVLAGPGGEAVLTVPLRATVVAVRVQVGDTVAVGAPLVEVLMPEVLDAAGRFEGAHARLGAWGERLAQLTGLRAEGLARAVDVSEAAARVAEARADLQAARATLLSAGVREGGVGALLAGAGTLTLRAPVAGVVVAVEATLGESRDSASGPLVRLSAPAPVRIEARFARPPPEGDWVLVTAQGRTPVTLTGRAPAADPRDGTVVTWFEAAEGAAPPAGTLGRVSLASQQRSDIVRVPARAVHRVGGVPTVTTRDASLPVDVLSCGGSDCLVRGALAAGDVVSLEGAAPVPAPGLAP